VGLEIAFVSRLWLAMVLECINSWLFSHVKCSISLPASCILPTILRSYTSALQRAANEASTRLALHSVRCNWYNNADITRYWYVAGEHWQVRARTKYPGAGCSIGAPRTSSSLNIHWLPVGHRITYKLCLTTWKTLHTSQPLYLSELISHYLPIQISLPDQPVLLATFPLWLFLCLHLLLIGTMYLHTFVLSIPYPPLNATLYKFHLFPSLPLPSSHPVPAPQIRSHNFDAILCIVCMYVRL